ncbi:acidic phospholipase A2 PA4-like [Hydra vulgaris]|uniref:Acidic phospholipase A2 PA4-like n=1 Tax=Hydra vulgaris TaxID=6087 RepID=A0ABM4CZ42_HYDVU
MKFTRIMMAAFAKLLFGISFFPVSLTINPFVWKGTRWCGYESLPTLNSTMVPLNESHSSTTDLCCKNHDHCPLFIPRWKSKYNLLNWRPYTISSCDCDRKFKSCLKNDSSVTANDIDRIYFSILEVPCFNIEYKVAKKCLDKTWFLVCKNVTMAMEAHAVLDKI